MKNYDPKKYGAVEAIRIFIDEYNYGYTPMAELAFAFGGTETIRWDVTAEREKYAPGINGFTYIYDERPKSEFKDWVKPADDDYHNWMFEEESEV